MSLPIDDTESEHLISTTSGISSAKDEGSYPRLGSLDEFDVSTRTSTSRRLAFIGVGSSVVFSIMCIIAGILVSVSNQDVYSVVLPPCWRTPGMHGVWTNGTGHFTEPWVVNGLPWGQGMVAILPNQQSSINQELIGLLLNLVVTGCTEAIGFVHAAALKSTLAAESRLRFNTNLRLLTAAQGKGRWFNPNGSLCNGVMAILLIVSYVSSSMVLLPFEVQILGDINPSPPACPQLDPSIHEQWKSTCIFATPITILGLAILLQAIIALLAARSAKFMIWTSSPIDTTVILLQKGHIVSHSGRCMCSVVEADLDLGPQIPSERQPSPWRAHTSIRKLIRVLWFLIFACVAWGCTIFAIWKKSIHAGSQALVPPSLESWSLFPSTRTTQLFIGPAFDTQIHGSIWIIILMTVTVTQGSLTLGLHCSELLVNVIRDEDVWRHAGRKRGIIPSSSPLAILLASWPNIILLITKPVLHWLFGLALNLQGTIGLDYMLMFGVTLQMTMRIIQIWYLGIALFVFSLFTTYMSLCRPSGPQPAAYGHVQTLANLVDDWSPIMWWGDKTHGTAVGHAGTSKHPLPMVEMNRLYAGTSHHSECH